MSDVRMQKTPLIGHGVAVRGLCKLRLCTHEFVSRRIHREASVVYIKTITLHKAPLMGHGAQNGVYASFGYARTSLRALYRIYREASIYTLNMHLPCIKLL